MNSTVSNTVKRKEGNSDGQLQDSMYTIVERVPWFSLFSALVSHQLSARCTTRSSRERWKYVERLVELDEARTIRSANLDRFARPLCSTWPRFEIAEIQHCTPTTNLDGWAVPYLRTHDEETSSKIICTYRSRLNRHDHQWWSVEWHEPKSKMCLHHPSDEAESTYEWRSERVVIVEGQVQKDMIEFIKVLLGVFHLFQIFVK